MIALLSGILRHVDPASIIIDVNGVGYQVGITTQTQSLLGPVGSALTLHIVTQVREDAITLFGFSARDEKESFLKLTTIQGVGSRMALNLLSTLNSEQLWRAILSDDKKLLTSAEGVGPKLAARLTTELKDYAGKQVFPGGGSISKSKNVTSISSNVPAAGDITREAVSALINLGYSPTDAARAVSLVANENDAADLSTMIRLGLQQLSNHA
jgi:Holliday junction DNA helicase RuvA